MDLNALYDGNFSQLSDAITDWEQMTKNLAKVEKDAHDHLKAKADKANWAGVNAQVSREFIDKTAAEFTDAHTQADSITNILKDTYDELVDYRNQLNDAISRAQGKNITVIDTGKGSFEVMPSTRPDWASDSSGNTGVADQKDVDATRDEIQRILSKATTSDTSAANALRMLVDQAKYGFSNAHFQNRDEAAKSLADADRMAEILAKDPHKVTNTELASLNRMLTEHKEDPLFAEEFARKVGPKKVLTFWAGIADPYQATYDPARAEQAKQLQKNLGTTIGLATLSDSDKMQSWEKQMIELGPDQLGIDDASDPTGYAVMSNLMRFGDYDDQFLNDYGDHLLAYDKKVNGAGISLWVNNANQGDLNYWDKNDRGRDPVTGFLQALGHNPDASAQFFAQPSGAGATVDKSSELNAHLTYLTEDRVWTPDITLEGKDGYVAGRDALGHALEAATTGYSYDATADQIKAGGDHRTAATAGVMEQVSYIYGTTEDGPKLLHGQPELADSLGKMAGAYIDDIDYELSGIGDSGKDAGTFPPQYEGRANFTNQGAINFLSVLGQNEDSHRAVSAAQNLYTLSSLSAHPATSDANIDHARSAMTVGATARGILDYSRVEQVKHTYQDDAAAANASLSRSGDWIKMGTGALVGAGVAAIPLPGSTAAAVFIAPIAAGTAGEAVKTFLGHEIDSGLSSNQQDPTEKGQIASVKFYADGENQLGETFATYIKENSHGVDASRDQEWERDIKYAYTSGSVEGDHRGRTPC
ncbi:hypothetical protein ACF09H_30835 [Streptomyces sp. NPDC014983]|uniref:hypothetical protein n=1 Tax=Streptomyces sp. NPDC014983 TaxID=3364933 RepID=UPI0036FCC24B